MKIKFKPSFFNIIYSIIVAIIIIIFILKIGRIGDSIQATESTIDLIFGFLMAYVVLIVVVTIVSWHSFKESQKAGRLAFNIVITLFLCIVSVLFFTN